MSKKQVKQILAKIEELPQFSYIADKAMIAERERSTKKDYANSLGFHDPKLAREILQLTNFTAYGFSGKKAGSFEADIFKSADILRGIMLAHTLQDFLSKELDGYMMLHGELWEHSMNCALSAWMIATKIGYTDLENVFIAGLMHDIGKVVIDEFLSAETMDNVDISSRDDVNLVEEELRVLGINHAEVGARIASKWDFSEKIVDVIGNHHQPEDSKVDPDLTTIIHLADITSMTLGQVFSDNNLAGLITDGFSKTQLG